MGNMKILVLNYEYPPIGGGAAPVSKDLAEELAASGNDVSVLTMKYGDLPEYIEENGVNVYRLPCLRKKIASCSPIEQLSYLLAVSRFMKKHPDFQDYDVCHSHFVIPTAEAARHIKAKYRIPYIITAHGSDVEGHNRKKSVLLMHRFLRGFWRKIVSNAYCVVSPSEYLKDRMHNNFPNGDYRFIPNGVEYELFSKLNDLQNKQKKILVMGRIQKFKNVQLIVEAFSKIKEKDGWTLTIVGDGPYKDSLVELINYLGIRDMVQLTGWLDNKSEPLLNIISSASIYVSASTFENCPMSVIESTIAGCYPLVSDIPAHRQLLPADNLFSLDSADELISKLSSRIEMGIGNNNLDLSKYSWKNIAPRYEQLMSETIKNSDKQA